jgi:hypothetical protein
MATFDQLSDEQRAIVELVLQQGRSYDELSGMLGLPERRVRELARDALVDLAPLSARGVEEDWRGQLADYVLGQQAGPEVTATRGHLRRSEAARVWTGSLLDSLEQLYRNGDMPAVPDGERGRTRAATTDGESIKRRRILAIGATAVVILAAVLLWPVGLLTGNDDEQAGGTSANGPPASEPVSATAGGANIFRQGGKTRMLVQAVGLEPSTETQLYQVWLYNSANDRRALGLASADQQGNLGVAAPLPADYRKYKLVDLTSVTVQGQEAQPGRSVLRGLLELLDKPVSQASGKTRVTLLARIRLLPLPDAGG